MRRVIPILTVLFLSTSLGTAWAERCIGPKDNDWPSKVDPITQADITWCDDFDTYCDTNCGDVCCPAVTAPPWDCTKCQSVWPAHSVWPGYPPVSDNLCDPNGLDPDGCPNGTSEYYFRRIYHWPRPQPLPAWSSAVPSTDGTGSDWKGWDGNPGWLTEPYVVKYQGGGNTNQYHLFDIRGAIGHKFEGDNTINGTEDNPLVLRFWLNTGAAAGNFDKPSWYPFYAEVILDATPDGVPPPHDPPNQPNELTDARAPTDYADVVCGSPINETYPSICQKDPYYGRAAGCPTTLSTSIVPSLAFGQLAQLDATPCDNDSRKPTLDHAVTFDGNRWYELRNSVPNSTVTGEFEYNFQQGYFEMKIRTNEYDLKLFNRYYNEEYATGKWYCDQANEWCEYYSTATLPRKYTGPFNKVAFGAGPSCKLDPNTGTCVTPVTYDVWRYMQTGEQHSWDPFSLDRMALRGGEPPVYSCCRHTGICEDGVEPDQCPAANGDRPRTGRCTDPGAPLCCPYPFADRDKDGDVDQVDFADWQRCYTNTGGGVLDDCDCLDREPDGDVDGDDYTAFRNCWTGPNVPFDPEIHESCVP